MLASMLPVPTTLANEPTSGTPHPRNADPQTSGDGVAALSSFSGAVIDNGLFQLRSIPKAT